MKSGPAAYLAWALCFAGLAGLHRFYLGRPVSGLIWLLTLGLLGVGQVIDLFLIPGMLREEATQRRLNRMDAEQTRLRRV